jgi:hypothetical protein
LPRELRESLIEALYDRVDLWQRDPTSEAVFGPAADDEVARLVETPGFAGDLVGRHAAGMLFWCRFLALGEADQGTYSIASTCWSKSPSRDLTSCPSRSWRLSNSGRAPWR